MGNKQSINAPEKLAAKFQYTIEMSQEAVFWLGRDGKFTYVNEQACRSLGYTDEELLSLFLWDIDPDFPAERWDDQWEQLKSTGQIILETRHRRKDGSIFPVEVSACQVDFEGKVFHAAFVRNISDRNKIADELQKRESLYRSLFDNVPDGILVADQKSYYLDANQEMCNMLGYSRKELIGRHAADIVSHQEAEPIEPALAPIKIGFEHSREWQLRRKDGSIFDAEVRVNKMPDGTLLALVRDITRQKQSEADKSHLEKQLHQSQKMEAVGTMAGGIAHDFNNLLTMITSNIDSMENKRKDGVSDEDNLKNIKGATLRATSLVRQILAFSRQEKVDLKRVDLKTVVDESLKLLRSTLPSTVEILSRIGSEHVFVEADTTQLQQILINLCTNAVHAMDEKGLLTIGLEITDLSPQDIPVSARILTGKYAKLTIRDTGVGMNEETLGRIFDPFFTTKDVGVGTGMGLSMVHGIAEQHGGYVTAESTQNNGATFCVYLPVSINAATEVGGVKEDLLPTGTERILFVDDEECIAETCGELLEYQGYKVTSVTSSAEALEIFKTNPEGFDLVFTDQTMPNITGMQLAAELLTIRADIPIILCSGYNGLVSESEAKGLGLSEFCIKPMDMEKLARVARKILDERE